MRVTRSEERRYNRLLGAVAVAFAVVLGTALEGRNGAFLGGGVGALLAFALDEWTARRERVRVAAIADPLPESTRAFLVERYDHYNRLPPEWRARFEDDLRIFLAEKRITGVETKAKEELRLLAAASAVTLSLGWREYTWDQLTEVLLYPQAFDRDYKFSDEGFVGMVPPTGEVILSVPSLRRGFRVPDDGYNVGLHEFAHLLASLGTAHGGVPEGLTPARQRQWVAIAEKEMERLREGEDSALDDYGAHSLTEFLPVSVEAFFEIPTIVRRQHPELYAFLADFFRQDPAAWDDQRGVSL